MKIKYFKIILLIAKFGFNTPCAVKGDRCYDCSSSDRICNAMVVHMKKMNSVEAEIILIDEPLGF